MKHILRGLVALTAIALFPAAAQAATWTIDASHSTVVFNVIHVGAGSFWGTFNQVTGTFDFDEANPAKSKVDITVDANSIFTADKKRDSHLKSPDFFNTKQFPVFTFKSKAVAAGKAAGTYAVTGDLTVRGVTKTVTVTMKKIGEGSDPWGNKRIGFEGELTIDRTDFGVSYMPGGLSKKVRLIIAVEGMRK